MTDQDAKASSGDLQDLLRQAWLDGYDEGRRHGVAVMVKTFRQVMAANGGMGLSAEATEAVFDAVTREVGETSAKDCSVHPNNERRVGP